MHPPKQFDYFSSSVFIVASANLNFLNSYLRSTMSQDRLNSLILISIENNVLKNLDYEQIINGFATKKCQNDFK